MFKQLELYMWRQFSDLRIVFHDRVTVITGVNGSGKSTILQLLSGFMDYEKLHFFSTPTLNSSGEKVWSADHDEKAARSYLEENKRSLEGAFGTIWTSNIPVAKLVIDNSPESGYRISSERQINEIGVYSVRPFRYVVAKQKSI